ncbi:MAG: tryptophanase, partial [Paramuribaculum sp.]|nr:tryptophanase [Paramuribaculum sp.]
KGHIESRHAVALDCTIDEAKNTQLEHPFKGSVDPVKLEKALAENADKIPFIIVTITNNTAGGQPVSMKNLKEVRAIADKYGKRVVFDSARFAENAYFIKTREEGYADKSIKEITREMFDLADGMTMSAKKDGIVNMGGFIATRHADWFEAAKNFCIPFEGYLTYGGMNGRDMAALAVGLDENTEFDNLQTRIHQVEYLAKRLDEFGIPYQRPAGGHAIFIDASKVLTAIPKEEFPAQTLTIELYKEAGIRGCEIGYILADRDPVTRENRFGGLDLLRLAIPRRVYTDNHMDVIAVALKNVYDRRDEITRGVRITWEAELMRHFTVQLEPLG